MNVDEVESLLERSRPAPPPPDLRRRLLEAVDRTAPPAPVSPRRTRWMEVMTVAASIFMLLATVSWLLRTSPQAEPQAPVPSGQPFEERRITEQLGASEISRFTWSADGKHWACVIQMGKGKEARYAVVVDGKTGPEFHRVEPPKFGADGVVAYLASGAINGPNRLVLGGVPQTGFDSYRRFAWSPDGKKLAFIGGKGGKVYVVRDGAQSEPYSAADELLWSPDGKSLAYAAGRENDYFVVLDGSKGEPFDEVYDLTFLPDGKTLAYVAKEGGMYVVIGGVKSPEYKFAQCLVFSGDGTKIGYVGGSKAANVLVGPIPGREMTSSENYMSVEELKLSSDGKVWAFSAKLSQTPGMMVVTSREHQKNVRFIVDGKEETRTVASRGEERGPGYEAIDSIALNRDGSLLAYVGLKGSRRHLVVGNSPVQKFSVIDRMSFGPDDKTLAYRAGQYGKQFVVAGQARSEEFDQILSGPVWSPDGKKVAFTAQNGSEIWSRVLDVK
jgi:Tol biopolymer transport system component